MFVPLNGDTILANKKLRKVPLNIAREEGFEVVIDLIVAGAAFVGQWPAIRETSSTHGIVDCRLGKDWERSIMCGRKLLDLYVGTGFLVVELVAGKCKNLEATGRVPLLQQP